jgi:hypothetical protein
MIDDDGSGTTGTILNNAWLQTIYNQIDGLVQSAQVWTPVDVSGAGLVFSVASALYLRTENQIALVANLTFPVTGSGAPAAIGGLPLAARIAAGAYVTYGPAQLLHIPGGNTKVLILDPATNAAKANSQLSGAALSFVGLYFV